jgi:hypothetical protein
MTEFVGSCCPRRTVSPNVGGATYSITCFIEQHSRSMLWPLDRNRIKRADAKINSKDADSELFLKYPLRINVLLCR